MGLNWKPKRHIWKAGSLPIWTPTQSNAGKVRVYARSAMRPDVMTRSNQFEHVHSMIQPKAENFPPLAPFDSTKVIQLAFFPEIALSLLPNLEEVLRNIPAVAIPLFLHSVMTSAFS